MPATDHRPVGDVFDDQINYPFMKSGHHEVFRCLVVMLPAARGLVPARVCPFCAGHFPDDASSEPHIEKCGLEHANVVMN